MNEETQELKKKIIQKILSKEAIERLGRVRLSKPELAEQVELYLLQLYKAGKLKEEISDEQLKAVLEALTTKKEFRIIK
jgi:programmed cell death protein 5